jgi:hypothetical protein
MSNPKVWENKQMNDHRWAFVHACKRLGDYVVVEFHGDARYGRADILVDTDPTPVLKGTLRVRAGVEKALRESYLARPL